MRTEQAEAAAALARAGSVTAAAAALGISQSSVSRRLAALESDVGVPLFARSPAGTAPTAAGGAFLAALPDVLLAAAALRSAAAGPSGGPGAGRIMSP